MNSVCIAGASGFIGRNLVKRLQDEGFIVKLITREDFKTENLEEVVKDCSIVINLTGESIAGFWTRSKKKRIYDSRILTSRQLIDAINRSGSKLNLYIQVSGVGIYDRYAIHTEDSLKFDDGFLSTVIRDWEKETVHIIGPGVRVVIMRLGIVLDKEGGLLSQMMRPLKWAPGFGVQSEDYFPYVNKEDLINAFMFSIGNEGIEGIVNVVSPGLTKINHFFTVLMRILGKRRIIWFRRGLIKLVAGESGSLLVTGQNVVPAKLKKHGFDFRYDNIEDALIKACN